MGKLFFGAGITTKGLKPQLIELLNKHADEAPFDVMLTSGYRSFADQQLLYDRWLAGDKSVVTPAKPGTSPHQYGAGYDMVPWNTKANKAYTDDSKRKELADVGRAVGLTAGYYFRRKDYPHYELPGWRIEAGKGPRTVDEIVRQDVKTVAPAPVIRFSDFSASGNFGRDAFGNPIEESYEFKQVAAEDLPSYVPEAALQPGAFRIGDIWLSIPPQSITISSYQINQELSTMRSPGNPMKKGDLHDIRIDLQLLFPNAETINTELRPILAQFVTSPIINIENFFIQKATTPDIAPAEGYVRWNPEYSGAALNGDAAQKVAADFAARQKANADLFHKGTAASYAELRKNVANDKDSWVDVEDLIKQREASKAVHFTRFGWAEDDQPILCTFDDISVQTVPGFPNAAAVGISLRLFNHRPFCKKVAWVTDWQSAENQIRNFAEMREAAYSGLNPLAAEQYAVSYAYTPELSKVYIDYYRNLLPEYAGMVEHPAVDTKMQEIGVFQPYTAVESQPDTLNLGWLNPTVTPAQMLKSRVDYRKKKLKEVEDMLPAMVELVADTASITLGQIFENITLAPKRINTILDEMGSMPLLKYALSIQSLGKNMPDSVVQAFRDWDIKNEPAGTVRTGIATADNVKLRTIFALWAAVAEDSKEVSLDVRKWFRLHLVPIEEAVRNAVAKFNISQTTLTSLKSTAKELIKLEEQMIGYIPTKRHNIKLSDYDAIITGISGAMHNKFVRMPLIAEIVPSYQHMGRSNTAITVSIQTTSLDLLAELRRTAVETSLLEQLRGLYQNGAKTEFMESNVINVTGNRIFDLLGVRHILIGNMSTSTVPNSPGLYNVSFDAVQADYALYQYEKISGYNAVPGTAVANAFSLIVRNTTEALEWFNGLDDDTKWLCGELIDAIKKHDEIVSKGIKYRVDTAVTQAWLAGATAASPVDTLNAIVNGIYSAFRAAGSVEASGMEITSTIALWQSIRNTFVNKGTRKLLEDKLNPAGTALAPLKVVDGKLVASDGTLFSAMKFEQGLPYVLSFLDEVIPQLEAILRNRKDSALADIIQVELGGTEKKLYTPGDLYFYRDGFIDNSLVETAREMMQVEHAATVAAQYDMMAVDIDKYTEVLLKDFNNRFPEATVKGLSKKYQKVFEKVKANHEKTTANIDKTEYLTNNGYSTEAAIPSAKEAARDANLAKETVEDVNKLKARINRVTRSVLRPFGILAADRLKNKQILPQYMLRQMRRLNSTLKTQAMCELAMEAARDLESAIKDDKKAPAVQEKTRELDRLLYHVNQETDQFQTAFFLLQPGDQSDDILFDPILGALPNNVGEYEEDIFNRISLMSAYDRTLHMSRAYPTFKLYLIEKDSPQWLLFDDFYSYDAVVSIDVLQNADMATKTAVIRLSNVTAVLSDERAINREMPMSAPNTISSNSKVTRVNLQAGAMIALKLGYDADPSQLTTRFVGTIVEVSPGPEMEIVAQSAGAQLLQVPYPKGDSIGFTSGQRSPGSVAGKIIADCQGLKGFGRWGAVEAMNPDLYDPRQSASEYWKKVAQESLGMPFKLGLKDPAQDNIYLDYVMSPYAWANWWLIAGGVFFSLAPGMQALGLAAWIQLGKDKRLTFDWKLDKDKTVWDLLQEIALYNNNYILTTKLYNADVNPGNIDRELRETIYLGPRRGIYKAGDSVVGSNQRQLGEQIKEHIDKNIDNAYKAIQDLVNAIVGHITPGVPGSTARILDFGLGPEMDKLTLDLMREINKDQARGVEKKEKWVIKDGDDRKFFDTNVSLSKLVVAASPPNVVSQLQKNKEVHIEALRNLYNLNLVASNLYVPPEQLAIKHMFDRTGVFMPLTKYHFIDSSHHIIANNIVASATQMYNRVRLLYPNRETAHSEDVLANKPHKGGVAKIVALFDFNTEVNEAVVSADDDIYPDAIREVIVPFGNIDTNLLEEPWLNPFKKGDNWNETEMRERAQEGRYGKAYQVAINALCRYMEPMYQGELVVVGDPSIEPFDEVYLADFSSDMIGPIVVGQVVDHLDASSGYTSTITPKLYVRPADLFNSINADYGAKCCLLASLQTIATGIPVGAGSWASAATLNFLIGEVAMAVGGTAATGAVTTAGAIVSSTAVVGADATAIAAAEAIVGGTAVPAVEGVTAAAATGAAETLATGGAVTVTTTPPGWIAGAITAAAIIVATAMLGSKYVSTCNKYIGGLLGREAVDMVPLWYRGRPLLAGVDGAVKNDWYTHFIDSKVGNILDFLSRLKEQQQ